MIQSEDTKGKHRSASDRFFIALKMYSYNLYQAYVGVSCLLNLLRQRIIMPVPVAVLRVDK